MSRQFTLLMLSLALSLVFWGCEPQDEGHGSTSERAPAGEMNAYEPTSLGESNASDAAANDAQRAAPNQPNAVGDSASAGEAFEGASENEPAQQELEPAETLQWIQLSTDDSTSMASAQLHKSGQRIYGHSLKVHEFLNYYDPPLSLFAQEDFSSAKNVNEFIRFGLKADYETIDLTDPDSTDIATEELSGGNSDGDTSDDAMGAPPPSNEDLQDEDHSPENATVEETTVQPSVGTLEVLFQMQADAIPKDTRRNWNLFLCVDVSGSMEGEKLDFTIEALNQMLAHLKSGDRITLTTFSSEASNILVDLEYSENEDSIRSAFSALRAGGGTNMIAGLNNSYNLAQSNFEEGMLHRVILFGDGSANVGETDLEAFNRLTRINGQEGIYLSGVGVGMNYSFERMDALTDAGKGAHIFLPNREEVDIIFGDYFPKLVEVAADAIAIEATLPEGLRLSGFSGEEVSFNPNERLQNIVLATGDDLTFTAKFDVLDEAALEEPFTLKVTLRPLGSGELVIRKIDVDSIQDLIAEPGRLFQRTRLIHRYGKLVVNAEEDRTQLMQDLENYPDPDWGIREILSLMDDVRN